MHLSDDPTVKRVAKRVFGREEDGGETRRPGEEGADESHEEGFEGARAGVGAGRRTSSGTTPPSIPKPTSPSFAPRIDSARESRER